MPSPPVTVTAGALALHSAKHLALGGALPALKQQPPHPPPPPTTSTRWDDPSLPRPAAEAGALALVDLSAGIDLSTSAEAVADRLTGSLVVREEEERTGKKRQA